MPREDYIYAVTRAHIHERGLLTGQDVEQLVSAADVREVLRLLREKGWGAPEQSETAPDALVAYELEKTWSLLSELLDDLTPFDALRIPNDYHNLKAAVKAAHSAPDDADADRYFLRAGAVPVETLIEAARAHDFSSLPAPLDAVGKEAYEALAHTGNGQLCDIVIDRAALAAIFEAGQAAESLVLRTWAEVTVDGANIKSALRCALMKKDRQFIDQVIAPVGTLNTTALASAAAEGPEQVYAVVAASPYAGAAERALRQSLAAFERWCDNRLMALIRPMRHEYFGIEPLVAFALGRENDVRLVRLIIGAKRSGLGEGALRERLRETYV